MKIIEKKCPNCKANLKFNAGDHEARCESCRREYIIEYDATEELADKLKEAAAKFNPDDFNLKPAAKMFGTIFAIHSIIIAIVSVVIIAFVAVGIIVGINNFNAQKERSEQMKKEHQETVEQMEEEFKKNVEEMKNEHQSYIKNPGS